MKHQEVQTRFQPPIGHTVDLTKAEARVLRKNGLTPSGDTATTLAGKK